jgi:hypothetical protein
MRSRWVATALAALVTAAVLALLLSDEVLHALATALGRAAPGPLLLALLLGFAVQYLRAWRFGVMSLGRTGPPTPALVGIALRLNLFNFLLPFRLGEITYPVLMQRVYRQDPLHAAGVLLLARVFDLCLVAALFCLALLATGLGGGGGARTLLAAAALAAAGAPFVLVAGGRRAVERWRPAGRTGDWLGRLATGLDDLGHGRRARLAVGLTAAVWVAVACMSIAAASAVVDAFPAWAGVLGATAHSLAFALPVNGLAGVGPAPAAWAAAVAATGIDWSSAVVAALTMHAVAVAGALLFGLPTLLRRLGDAPSATP